MEVPVGSGGLGDRVLVVSDDRVFYGDVKPCCAPDSLADLQGPDGGVVTLPSDVLWAPGGGVVDLDEPGGTEVAYQALLQEGTAEQQVRFLHRGRLVRVWPALALPPRVRALWESRFSELTP